MIIDQLPIPNLYVWIKDKNSKLLECNENFARIAGLDSAHQIKNKTDYQLPWKKQGESIVNIDSLIINSGKVYLNSAKCLNISFRTVEEYIDKLKCKLECESKHEIISKAMKYGLNNLTEFNQ